MGRQKITIAYNKLVQNYTRMGLKLVDLEIKNTVLKAAWPVRWREKENNLKWLFEHLPIKDSRIWECNISEKDISKIFEPHSTTSPIYSIWRAWARATYRDTVENLEEVLNMSIWGNSLIRRQGKPIFNKEVIESKIDKIIDIYDPGSQRLMTIEQIVNTFGQILSPLLYQGIKVAIPTTWKVILRNELLHGPYEMETTVNSMGKIERVSKRIYWTLIEKEFLVSPGAKIIWQKDLGLMNLKDKTWWEIFPKFIHQIKPTKLWWFQYRVLTRTLTTNERRSKWNSKISDKCTFCKRETETILHLLTQCDHVQNSWSNLKRICSHFLGTDANFTYDVIILNNYQGPSKELVNLFIVILKQYIYVQKCFEVLPTFTEYMGKLAMWYQTDLCYATQIGS